MQILFKNKIIIFVILRILCFHAFLSLHYAFSAKYIIAFNNADKWLILSNVKKINFLQWITDALKAMHQKNV